jgi:choline dehydrogenase-like flavoprotein
MRSELLAAAPAWAGDDDSRRSRALRALCDTFVPAVRPPRALEGDPDGFFGRRASDLRVDRAVAGYIHTRLAAADREGLGRLVDLLAATGFARLPQPARERLVLRLRGASPELREGIDGLRALTMLLFYGLPLNGFNPNWTASGYTGPPVIDASTHPRAVRGWRPIGGVVDSDVVVVGSGAGGGVIAAVLAEAGLDVVVLEAGGHFEEPDFDAHELPAYRDLYWRGGWTPTQDGTVVLAAGGALGGGTTLNWTACVPPPARVREQWCVDHGLEGLDGPQFDDHLAAVTDRLKITESCSEPNGPNARLRAGADALGWSWRAAGRNADPATFDPATAGAMAFGDRSGSKQTATKTWLVDAEAAGARIVTGCTVERVEVQRGRATGVTARLRQRGAGPRTLEVRARTVVVAGGALETPALLLRSGIGGPAAGRFLRLHPVVTVAGIYDEEQAPWWGPPLTTVVHEFADAADGYGFLIENPFFGPGMWAASFPWRGGRDHKLISAKLANTATFLGLVRDRGSGRVTIDAEGQGLVTYPLDDPLDRRHLQQALAAMVRIHVAAGARAVLDLSPQRPIHRRGGDLDGYLDGLARIPFSSAGGRPVMSAHQMGSARMGRNRGTSVADPEGQLHDVRGVWIGDTSAFPTPSGSNPMLTCMALARRTAQAILAARPR